ncbi:superoxide dismutase family protein [Pseudonocardia sp. MH-G8]|uniref:superoxide dismutase family protein n=1 Tax=Pseudonocardia sp. MH-G8 TaxID=1854588 RepID=UPI000BA13CFF|nr:superoxide dismutase family protein [Pseudonocardia sp. MH-G8]OZM78937.1 superoxide dismutase [Pseudonocardia sp. MH-G8]
MTRSTRPRAAWLPILLTGTVLAAVACGGPEPAPPAPPDAPLAPPTPSAPLAPQPALAEVEAEGTLAAPEQAQDAFTYDPAQAPAGAELSVEAGGSNGATQVQLDVDGLLPDRGYAAHAHARPCGPTGDAAGPHFQNEVDPAATPEQPSTDPAYANPQNEIWLDLRTDSEGDGEASTEVPFVFRDRAPASVIIHAAESTATAPGEAGSAGGRLACLNVPFDQAASG